MANKVLSIEIGSQTTRVCEVDYKKKNPHVYHCISFDTPEGVIEDGFIRDGNSLSVVLREKLATHAIDNRSVVFTLASSKIANREVIIPSVSDNKVAGIVAANAADYFPVNIDDYIVTHKILEKAKSKEDKNMRLLVLAAPSNLIQTYYDFARIMDLDIVALDYIGNSSYQLIKRQVSVGTNLIVQINEQTTLINILQEDVLVLQRTVPYGTEIAASALLESGEFNVRTIREAQDLMSREHMINVKFGYTSQEVASAMDANSESYNKQIRTMKAKEDITETFRYLVNNIIRVLDYYMSKNPNSKFDAIYIAGPGAKLRGISHLFRNEIAVETIKKFDRLYAVNFNKNVDVTGLDESEYLSCIGSTVEPVEFISKENLMREQKKSNMAGLTLVCGAAIVAAIILVIFSFITFVRTNSEKNKIEDEILELSPIENVYNDYTRTKTDYEALQSMYLMTKSYNENFVNLLEEMEEKLPSSVLINRLVSDSTGVSIAMSVATKREAAKVLLQFKTMKSLINTDMASLKDVKDMGVQRVVFIVTGEYASDILSQDLLEGEVNE